MAVVEMGRSPLPSDKKIVHAIGFGHADLEWHWAAVEGKNAGFATFQSALDRMGEDPDYQFTANQAVLFDYTRRAAPNLFGQMQNRGQEGRLHPAGYQWTEPDGNMPSGESVLRNYLLGGRFMDEYFRREGKKIAVFADTFGHAATVGKLAVHAGMDGVVWMRPEPHEKGMPGELVQLQSDDGSTILAQHIRDYTTYPEEMDEHFTGTLLDQDGDGRNVLFFFGVGNHGGGPTRENIKLVRDLQRTSPHEIRFSNLSDHFTAVEEAVEGGLFVPTYNGELQSHATGCYSNGAELKAKNREAENSLLAAEKFSSLANALGLLPYPEELAVSQRLIAEGQFHDTAGATLPRAFLEKAIRRYDRALDTSEEVADTALGAIAANVFIPHEEGTTPLIIANSHVFQNTVPVKQELYLPEQLKPGARLVDNNGNDVPFQVVQSISENHIMTGITFLADLPSLGYRVYRFQNVDGEVKSPEFMDATDAKIENGRYRLTIDEDTGHIAGLYDKEKELDIFGGLAGVPVVIDEHTDEGKPFDTWAHDVYRFDQRIGQFNATHSSKLIEHGEVQSTIRVKSGYKSDPDSDIPTSTMTQDFTMYQGLNMVKVDVILDWHERHKMLKLRFPTGTGLKRRNTFEIPYGTLMRGENGLEVPHQSYVDISGTHAQTGEHVGVTIINDGKYSGDVTGNTYNMTVLRSPVYAHHNPRQLDADKDYDYMDQGIHRFSYWIVPHDDTWKEAQIPQLAAVCNQPPHILAASSNEHGTLPQSYSFAEVGANNVTMPVVKRAEDPTVNAHVVRLHETHGRTTITKVRVGQREIDVVMKQFGLKSLMVPFNGEEPFFETDAMELKGFD